MSSFESFLKKHGVWVVLIIAIIVSIAATTFYYHHHQILAYNDAQSRLDIARRVTDSKTPGMLQLGTIWLPLQQLLLVPFTINYHLWSTGLAGSLVSMAAYVIAAVFVYKTILIFTSRYWLGVLGALLVMLNANVLYFQTTAMGEVLLLATLSGSIYYLLKWVKHKRDVDIILASLFAALTTLLRYEGWPMIIVCALVILIENRYFEKNKKKAQGQTILYMTLGAFGIFLWLLWNQVFFGRALYFLSGQNGQYTPLGHVSPAQHHLGVSITTFWKAMDLNVGLPLLIISILSGIYLIVRRSKNRRWFTYIVILLMTPLAFNLLTLFLGVTTIKVTSLHDLYNTRYAISAVLPVAILIPLALSKLPKWSGPLIAVLVLLSLATIHNSAYDSAAYSTRGPVPRTTRLVNFFHGRYKGGDILASTDAFDPAMQELGINLKNYIYEGNGKIWQSNLIRPKTSVKYVLMDKFTKGEPVYHAYVHEKETFDLHYETIYQKDGYTILARSLTNTNAQIAARNLKPRSKTQLTTGQIPTNAVVTIKLGDSETSIVQAEISRLDPNHTLTPIEVVYAESNMVQLLGGKNIIYPGNTLTINLDELKLLIEQSKQLTPNEKMSWQPYANNIVYM